MWVSEMVTPSVTEMKSLSAAHSILVIVFTGLVLLFKDLRIIYARGEGKNILRSVTPDIRVWQKKQKKNMAEIPNSALISRKSGCRALTIDLI